MRQSPPVAGLLLGVLVGIIDAVILETNFGRSQGPLALLPFTWAVVIWTWATTGCLTGAIFFSARWGRLRGVALALSGPCLLLLGRGTTPFKALTGLSTSQVLVIWLAVSVAICFAFAFMRFLPAKRGWLFATGAGLSSVVLVSLAAGVSFPVREAMRPRVPGKHNVALIVLDTVRYDDTVSNMPELMAFANRAASFENAWSSAPWTVPAHFALFTGADPWSIPFVNVSTGFQYAGPHLAEHFRSRGYDTAAVFANPLLNESTGFARGFDELTVSIQSRVCRTAIGTLLGKSVTHNGPRMPLCGWLIAPEVTSRATVFARRGERPFFLAANFMDAHDPYYVLPECRDASYRGVPRSHQQALLDAHPGRALDPRIGKRTRAQYRLAMRCMDRSVGALLRKLDDGNTVIAVVGDHGEQFGEHGFGGHGNSLYRQVLHVPLILKVPGRATAHVAEPVSTTDLFSSLIRAAEPGRARAPMPLFDPLWRRPVLSNFDQRHHRGLEGGFSVVRGDLHFMRSHPGQENLFDYRADPSESSPLVGDEHRATVSPLRDMLLRAARLQSRRVELDALGYLN